MSILMYCLCSVRSTHFRACHYYFNINHALRVICITCLWFPNNFHFFNMLKLDNHIVCYSSPFSCTSYQVKKIKVLQLQLTHVTLSIQSPFLGIVSFNKWLSCSTFIVTHLTSHKFIQFHLFREEIHLISHIDSYYNIQCGVPQRGKFFPKQYILPLVI